MACFILKLENKLNIIILINKIFKLEEHNKINCKLIKILLLIIDIVIKIIKQNILVTL
jgi:hypothetical protein